MMKYLISEKDIKHKNTNEGLTKFASTIAENTWGNAGFK